MTIALAVGVPQPVYEDRAQAVVVNYMQLSVSNISFSSHMPRGWSFQVQLDGDQNGRWGVGSGPPKTDAPTADRTFGLDANGKTYCFQHILTAMPEDPSLVFASSQCGRHPSRGEVAIGNIDDQDRRTITINLPTAELFGTLQTARIRVCVWDTKQIICQYTLADPLVLTRS
ncbi:MAG: hypothetical protein ABI667_08245 [Sphingomicrobium sp.]